MRFLLLVLAFSACAGPGSDEVTEDPRRGEPVDACVPPPPASDYPAGPYGGNIGDTVEDLELTDCDGETVRLRDVVQSAELTLVNVGAGWCRPCIEETAKLEAEVHDAFCPSGVRVVQILYQDQNFSPATPTFCRAWREEHGLEFPVLIDPLFGREVWFEDAQSQTPLNLFVDADGVIRERLVGEHEDGFLQSTISSLLDE